MLGVSNSSFSQVHLCPRRYLHHRDGVLQAVHVASLAFGCLDKHFADEVSCSCIGMSAPL